ncbi:LIM-type zinc finger-containing protein [Reticulomyxa filosa]|uniref:LIM-type zinc finger-containing protein n=1 Tax=Reticulomyxa filosa TaxID=46433 RepID=X6NE03_RETFI|nr:LIM-type zinc finger-containing protein [Reticulomyxa filosa]|eukprot:ETO24555.1 LIM-type zinc finger-containing protein [Reticulomyxa filosa]
MTQELKKLHTIILECNNENGPQLTDCQSNEMDKKAEAEKEETDAQQKQSNNTVTDWERLVFASQTQHNKKKNGFFKKNMELLSQFAKEMEKARELLQYPRCDELCNAESASATSETVSQQLHQKLGELPTATSEKKELEEHLQTAKEYLSVQCELRHTKPPLCLQTKQQKTIEQENKLLKLSKYEMQKQYQLDSEAMLEQIRELKDMLGTVHTKVQEKDHIIDQLSNDNHELTQYCQQLQNGVYTNCDVTRNWIVLFTQQKLQVDETIKIEQQKLPIPNANGKYEIELAQPELRPKLESPSLESKSLQGSSSNLHFNENKNYKKALKVKEQKITRLEADLGILNKSLADTHEALARVKYQLSLSEENNKSIQHKLDLQTNQLRVFEKNKQQRAELTEIIQNLNKTYKESIIVFFPFLFDSCKAIDYNRKQKLNKYQAHLNSKRWKMQAQNIKLQNEQQMQQLTVTKNELYSVQRKLKAISMLKKKKREQAKMEQELTEIQQKEKDLVKRLLGLKSQNERLSQYMQNSVLQIDKSNVRVHVLEEENKQLQVKLNEKKSNSLEELDECQDYNTIEKLQYVHYSYIFMYTYKTLICLLVSYGTIKHNK